MLHFILLISCTIIVSCRAFQNLNYYTTNTHTAPKSPYVNHYRLSLLTTTSNIQTDTNSNSNIKIQLEDQQQRVKNPETGRYIKQTGGSNKSSKWFQIMHKQGGYIKHRSSLVPIQLEHLQSWQEQDRKEKKIADRKKKKTKKSKKKKKHENASNSPSTSTSTSTSEFTHPPYDPDCSWSKINPSISIPTKETTSEISPNKDKNEVLPYLDQLLFVTKPSNLLTLPGIGEEKSVCLASEVNQWLSSTPDGSEAIKKAVQSTRDNQPTIQPPKKRKRKRDHDKKKNFVPRPCHRLDLDTSGAMVIALTQDSLRIMSALFESRSIQKTYVALVAGHLDFKVNSSSSSSERDEGIVEYPIGKVHCEEKNINEFKCYIPSDDDGTSHVRNKQKVWSDNKDGFVKGSLRDAKTEFRISKRFTKTMPDGAEVKYTRVHLKPLTGRGHQLRLHMAAIGAPILGDTLHAPDDIAKATPRLCLHAEKLEMDAIHSPGEGPMVKMNLLATSLPPF